MLGTNRFNAQAINSLSGKGRQVVVDAVAQLDTGAAGGAYDVQLSDVCVILHGNATMGAHYVDLPSVGEAQGMLLSLFVAEADATYTVTVQDRDDSANWTDLVFTAANDYALLYCDGHMWFTILEVTTP